MSTVFGSDSSLSLRPITGLSGQVDLIAVSQQIPIFELFLLFVVVGSLYVVYRLDTPRGAWGATLRSRLLFGVPWGTIVSMALVIGVYLFIQGGIHNRYAPTVIPFRAWSYLDPFPVVVSGFAHANYGHLRGNMIGTLALAPLAEFAFGHYTDKRGESTFSSLRTNPYIRAFVLFPLGVIAIGILTGVFSLGPSIGFSGVVYAFAGFALVYYPIATVVALTARQVISGLNNALANPVQFAAAEATYSTPWFAGIAVQGHAIGLLLGVVAGVALMWYRNDNPPTALRLWTGALLYAVSQSLWAIYWYRGGEQYILYRGLGLALVFILATIIAAAVVSRDRPLFPTRVVPNPTTTFESLTSGTTQQVAFVVLLVAVASLLGPTIPISLNTADQSDLPGDPIEIDGYEITYGEDVPDGMIGVVDIDAFGESTQVNTSGVIVRNTDRHIWTTATTRGRLAFDGRAAIRVGGVGWQETVIAEREGWRAANSGTAYRVSLRYAGEERTQFVSDPVTAEPTIAGQNITVGVVEDVFVVATDVDGDVATEEIPAENETAALAGLQIENVENVLFAVDEETETRVRVAEKERYGNEQR
ncbi:rhomboid family intramembrane serine protease [Natronocalculus amylovorans]|uniref:Rhomboid family intramembrane serine protease n=1 Tax=Natronocalculus amylovorans TaxID=2917812 RepID=A0AAE3FXY9_9EURY|nr:rhomboid family intramembrane serine protease [Natronocalculus amylovorans]MCL9817251.1 rhomboid family intramembrane serine protease [Natronocalculus amylovorans]